MRSLPGDVLLLAVTQEGRYLTKGDVGTVLAGALMCDEAVSRSRWTSTGIDPDDLVTSVLERAGTAVGEVSRSPSCAPCRARESPRPSTTPAGRVDGAVRAPRPAARQPASRGHGGAD